MDFQTAVRTCFSKYAQFSGRARRPEFWWFVLFGFVGNFVLSAVDRILLGPDAAILGPLFGLVLLIPSLSVGARRLHDTGRSGWWQLLHLIPLIGVLVLIWWWTRPTDPGENAYGPELLPEGTTATSVPRVPHG